ncbi:uncharacterized protein LOC133895414 [Phragmites australis]|uniref:uncharacterized protein LOC133895414 n=1 Tax=Phragmites australis TaxID=29695 RepID=UPI002D770E04|nr:uncharacterized protein LOC133895414 [Phragmites australis]
MVCQVLEVIAMEFFVKNRLPSAAGKISRAASPAAVDVHSIGAGNEICQVATGLQPIKTASLRTSRLQISLSCEGNESEKGEEELDNFRTQQSIGLFLVLPDDEQCI